MKELSGLRRADAAIVGSGLTGLLLASSLAAAGMRVILLDTGDDTVPPCTAPGTILYAPIYRRIRDIHGLATARAYASALAGQLADMLTAAPPYVQSTHACLYARTPEDVPQLLAQAELLLQLGISTGAESDLGSSPFPVEAMLTIPHQALVDMAQWVSALAGNLRRCGGLRYACSPITSMNSRRVCTARRCVEAAHIIFAGGIPPHWQRLPHPQLLERRLTALRELHSPFPLYSCMLPLDEESLTLSPTPTGAIAGWDAGRCGNRRQEARLHAFDAVLSARLPDWQQGALHHRYEVFSLDGLPVIGNLPGTRHLFASGTDQAGILGALHAADLLHRRILGQSQPEDQLYAPDRPLPGWLLRQQARQQRAIRLESLLRPGAPVCSLCSCRMRYCPPASHWACPRCGSVFDLLGQVVCGPARYAAHTTVRQRPDW